MLKKEALTRIFSILFFSFGFLFFFTSPTVTGSFVGHLEIFGARFVSGSFLILLGFLFAAISRSGPDLGFHVKKNIEEDKTLSRLAEKARKNGTINRELDHLEKELERGNFSAGMGSAHLIDTRVDYVRGRNGARVYYVKDGSGIEIVAESYKDLNQEAVLQRLREVYARKKYR